MSCHRERRAVLEIRPDDLQAHRKALCVRPMGVGRGGKIDRCRERYSRTYPGRAVVLACPDHPVGERFAVVMWNRGVRPLPASGARPRQGRIQPSPLVAVRVVRWPTASRDGAASQIVRCAPMARHRRVAGTPPARPGCRLRGQAVELVLRKCGHDDRVQQLCIRPTTSNKATGGGESTMCAPAAPSAVWGSVALNSTTRPRVRTRGCAQSDRSVNEDRRCTA